MNYTKLKQDIEREIEEQKEIKLVEESQRMLGDLGIEVFK